MFQPGDSVCQRFIIEKLVGTDSIGEVYRCRDSELHNRLVAVKVLRSPRLQDSHIRDRIVAEVLKLRQIDHPHICTIHDVCRHENLDVIVMQFLYGASLAKLLANPLAEGDALRFGAQIADALACAHGHGVIHGDIRPGNIIVAPQGLKLIDFGLAPLSARDVTPFYMSPEQLVGKDLDARTDIYAFGVVLCQMCTGFSPQLDSGIAKRALIAGALQQVSSRPVRLIIEKCVRDEPLERWTSANELLRSLQAIAEPVAPHPRRPLGEKRFHGLQVTVGTLVIAVLLVLGWCSSRQSPSTLDFERPRRPSLGLEMTRSSASRSSRAD